MTDDAPTDDRRGPRVAGLDLRAADIRDVDLSGARLRALTLNGARISGAEMFQVEITGEIDGLVINGVDVAPLVEAELDRRDPERAAMRPTDPGGHRAAWEIMDRLWVGTVARARLLDPALLHERVDGEWSFIETLRHLVFAHDAWIGRVILGDPYPWHPLGLPFDQLPSTPGITSDPAARPGLDEMLVLRRDRRALVQRVLDTLTDERLDATTAPVTEPGWPEPIGYPLRDVLRWLLNEEWEHRRYAERDLTVLASRGS
ncbi:DinB family protein [Actinoplanes awajinensis]|uniref:DinB-like domain-containing protein n=1 Tax=Actinoplanes awajinensis subsp. mycoplanecinus TaxID=135947 RepID=A0A117MNW1_9ACTN|nr:DinB family protein [Actinoplanes awajinensis]KUL27536.1 hypothetical protein ADL15_35145 [Actinoplanes awajinensis subsp. mycoplanecinus]